MEEHYVPVQSLKQETIYAMGTKYISYTNVSNLKATFNSSGSGVAIKAIKKSSSGVSLSDVALNTEFSEPDFGTKYSEIDFAIMNTDASNSANVSYSTKGDANAATLESKWDSSEPTGYHTFTDNTDTACVIFNAAAGGTIKTIKTAVRRNSGSINGGIFEYTGNTLQPLGKKLGSFNVPLSSVPVFSYPYPSPYPGWTEADVSALKISTDKQFAVAYTYNIADNGLMVTDKYTGGGADHSYTYTTHSGTGTKQWLYYVTNEAGDTVSVYLSRAVIEFNNNTEEPVAATDFSLGQNYPNPFNPLTTIKYRLSAGGNTKLKVYDILGREVKTLVDGYKESGEYYAEFDASEYVSGIYLYELRSGSHYAVKKMLFIK
jgi:hypothetical protein